MKGDGEVAGEPWTTLLSFAELFLRALHSPMSFIRVVDLESSSSVFSLPLDVLVDRHAFTLYRAVSVDALMWFDGRFVDLAFERAVQRN